MNTTAQRRECYGEMFPDFTRLKRGEALDGQAFTALIVDSGTGAHGRNLEVNSEAWARCAECPDYRSCYDLSVAKLLMRHVLMNTMLANPWVGS